MEISAHAVLSQWETFYVIVGSSGAALTGLMFVVITLVADSNVPRNDGSQLRQLAERVRGREMDGIERSNGFDRKRPADSVEHRVCYGDDIAATLEAS